MQKGAFFACPPPRRSRHAAASLKTDVRRSLAVAAVLVVLGSCTTTVGTLPAVTPESVVPSTAALVVATATPVIRSGPERVVWRFTQTLLMPSNPNVYANVLLDIEPLAGSGWVVVQDRAPSRRLPRTGGASGGPFIPARGTVLRLDASGAIAAGQPDDAFTPTHIILFEQPGVVVAEGSGTRGLDLRTLDTLWSSDAECVAVGERCYAYRPQVLPPPGALEEREPRTFAVTRPFAQVQIGQLTTPMVLPDRNLAIVRSSAPDRSFDFFALDPSAPITLPWIDQLKRAKSIALLAADRMLVSYEGWNLGRLPKSELVDVGSGRVISSFDWLPVFTNRSVTFLQGQSPLQVLDARDASTGPLLPAIPLYVSLENGIIVVPLGNGGAGVLRREAAYAREYEITINKVAEGSCGTIDFARVQLADGTADCPGLAASAGARRILVSIGRERDSDRFEITRISVDEAARRLTISVRVGEVRSNGPAQAAPTQVIELPADIRGEWLVGLEPEPATPRPFGFVTAFAIDVR